MSAARGNQGALIAIIILVLLSLVLALVAFMGWTTAAEHYDVRTKLEQDKKYLTASDSSYEAQTTAFLAIVGGDKPGTAEIEKAIQTMSDVSGQVAQDDTRRENLVNRVNAFKSVVERYRADVAGSGASAADGDENLATYRDKIQDLTTLVAKMRNEVKIQVSETKDAEAQAKSSIETKSQELKVARDETNKMRKQLEETKQAALVDKQQLQDQLAKASKENSALTTKVDEAQTEISQIRNELTSKVDELVVQNAGLKRRLDRLNNQVYDTADGRIINVANSLNTVFINVGARDGLKVNRTFTVYDESITNFDRLSTPTKGTIEVIRVMPYRAEARVIDEDPKNPILADDQILTPAWDPGVPTRYALIGRFDMDGDKYDDTDKLIRIIERNGGIVAVRHDDQANLTGVIDPSIDLLVEGNSEIQGNPALIELMKQVREDAEKNSVSKMELEKLFKQLGIAARSTTERFDVPSGGFKARTLKTSDDR